MPTLIANQDNTVTVTYKQSLGNSTPSYGWDAYANGANSGNPGQGPVGVNSSSPVSYPSTSNSWTAKTPSLSTSPTLNVTTGTIVINPPLAAVGDTCRIYAANTNTGTGNAFAWWIDSCTIVAASKPFLPKLPIVVASLSRLLYNACMSLKINIKERIFIHGRPTSSSQLW